MKKSYILFLDFVFVKILFIDKKRKAVALTENSNSFVFLNILPDFII